MSYCRRVPSSPAPASTDSTRDRLLEATRVALAQYGPRKVSLSDIAALAGLSRPTLYRHFKSKEELLGALGADEKRRFEVGLAEALHGLRGSRRLDRALRYVVETQRAQPFRGLIATEPGHMLRQLEHSLHSMSSSLIPLFEETTPKRRTKGPRPADLADLVMRTALSHFLMPGDDDDQMLRELRHVAGLES
jgi:AcrR family transcriptional regulator